jgi:hypothetical protein
MIPQTSSLCAAVNLDERAIEFQALTREHDGIVSNLAASGSE